MRVHEWFDFIATVFLPFSACIVPNMRKRVLYGSISRNLLVESLQRITQQVEKKIMKILIDRLALVLNGLSSGDTNYVGMFLSYSWSDSLGYDNLLLTFHRSKKK